MKKVELLAPAGNKEAFFGSLRAGADAVYLAGTRFGARAYADNFTEEDIISCIRYAHLYGKKLYLTVNTLVKEEELKELYSFLEPFYLAGLDGLIIQDLGVLEFVKRHFPLFERHASTQMTITGPEGAQFLKDLGVCRVVPARELSLAEIHEIKDETGLEIECFIHGALCYCYSGQCLFSSVLGGRSGNRGRCAQPCRLPYTPQHNESINKQQKEQYLFSLKDLCTIDCIDELLEAGIDSFKIEGRMKRGEYAAGVTSIYRKYIDLYQKTGKLEVSKKDHRFLEQLYLRSERCDGYYHKYNGSDMVTLNAPGYTKGEEDIFDSIQKTYLSDEYDKSEASHTPYLPLSIDLYLTPDQPAILIENTYGITVTGSMVSKALNRPMESKDILKQLCKLGGTRFTVSEEDIQIYMEGDVFLPVKELNELRRTMVREVEDAIIASYGLPVLREPISANIKEDLQDTKQETGEKKGSLHVLVTTIDQYKSVLPYQNDIRRIYIEEECLLSGIPVFTEPASNKPDLYVALAPIRRKRNRSLRDQVLQLLRNHPQLIKGFLIRNLEDLYYLRSHKITSSYELITDANLYVWNREASQFLEAFSHAQTLPRELNKWEGTALLKKSTQPMEKIIYGHIPLMHTANCVRNTLGSCYSKQREEKGTHVVSLQDRMNKSIPILVDCHHCINHVYNPLPLSLHKTINDWGKLCSLRLEFTIESGHQVSEVMNYYLPLFVKQPQTVSNPAFPYTTGHEKHGVE